MNRIQKVFDKLKKNHKKALIPYFTAGYPSIEYSYDLFFAIEKGGGDIIEIGIPFSDPLADGPVIQYSSQIALQNGIKLKDVFELVRNIRETSETPVVFLVYYNHIFHKGEEVFIKECVNSGVDGLVVPDLPLEEREGFFDLCKKSGICLIPLISLNSSERIPKLLEYGSGFVYCISSYGVTGIRDSFSSDISSFIENVKSQSDIPVAVGFGISGPEVRKEMEAFADGVIVGSAIVKTIGECQGDPVTVEKFIRYLKS